MAPLAQQNTVQQLLASKHPSIFSSGENGEIVLSATLITELKKTEEPNFAKLALIIFKGFDEYFQVFHSKQLELEATIENQNKEIQTLRQEINTHQSAASEPLKLEVIEIKEKLEKCERDLKQEPVSSKREEDIEDLLQYQHRGDMLLTGPGVPSGVEGEDCSRIILEIVRNKLDVACVNNNIIGARRIGEFQSGPGKTDRRPIKFHTDPSTRHKILKKCVFKKPNFYFNDSLSVSRTKLFQSIRKIKKDTPFLFHKAFIRDGQIMMQKSVETSPVCIKTKSNLDDFLK